MKNNNPSSIDEQDINKAWLVIQQQDIRIRELEIENKKTEIESRERIAKDSISAQKDTFETHSKTVRTISITKWISICIISLMVTVVVVYSIVLFWFFSWLCCMACGILAP